MEQHVEVRCVREITSTIHMNILGSSDLIYPKATALIEDQLVFIYLIAGTPVKNTNYYLHTERYIECNNLNHNKGNKGIVKTLVSGWNRRNEAS